MPKGRNIKGYINFSDYGSRSSSPGILFLAEKKSAESSTKRKILYVPRKTLVDWPDKTSACRVARGGMAHDERKSVALPRFINDG